MDKARAAVIKKTEMPLLYLIGIFFALAIAVNFSKADVIEFENVAAVAAL